MASESIHLNRLPYPGGGWRVAYDHRSCVPSSPGSTYLILITSLPFEHQGRVYKKLPSDPDPTHTWIAPVDAFPTWSPTPSPLSVSDVVGPKLRGSTR